MSDTNANRPRVRCPQCGDPAAVGESNRWRPFCSRRCKLIDFGDWLDEFGFEDDDASNPSAPQPWNREPD
ncbi:MAG: DNA gyrase inhibitor YacG [Oceanococcaceae bacterium]